MVIVQFLVGLPASGKTYIRDNHINTYGAYVIASSDDYIEEYAAARGLTYNDVFKDAIKLAEKHFYFVIEDAIKSGKHLIIDRTNMNVKSRKKVMDFIRGLTDDVQFSCNVITTDNITWLKRLESREGKTIPFNVLYSMAQNFEYPTLEEGFKNVSDWKN